MSMIDVVRANVMAEAESEGLELNESDVAATTADVMKKLRSHGPDIIEDGVVEVKEPRVKMSLWRRIKFFYYDYIKPDMGARDHRLAVELCRTCDGSCCRCIGVPGTGSELRKITRRLGNFFKPRFYQRLYAITFSAVMMVEEIPELINKDLTRNGMKLKRCRAIGSGGRCRVHAFQPWYCYSFTCDGRTMAYHDHLAGKGLPVPEHIKRKM